MVGKQAYVQEMRLLGRQIGNGFNRVYPIDTGLHGSNTAKLTAARLQGVLAVFERVLVTLRSMKPPARVAADHRRLETGIEGVEAELTKVIKALDEGNFNASVVPSRLADIAIVDKATSSMENKGFDVLGER